MAHRLTVTVARWWCTYLCLLIFLSNTKYDEKFKRSVTNYFINKFICHHSRVALLYCIVLDSVSTLSMFNAFTLDAFHVKLLYLLLQLTSLAFPTPLHVQFNRLLWCIKWIQQSVANSSFHNNCSKKLLMMLINPLWALQGCFRGLMNKVHLP